MLKVNKSRMSLVMMAAVMVAFGLLLMMGCDSKSKLEETAVDEVTITVSASPSSFSVNSTTIVEATVDAGGAAVANRTVTFEVTPTDAGYFTPETALTDDGGVAASVFTATSIGNVLFSVSADLGDEIASTSVGAEVTATQQVGSGNIDIAVTPSLLLASGADTATVTVAVRDAFGQPAPDETLVKFTAGEKFVDLDGNGYWTAGQDSLVSDVNANGQWDASGFIPSTATTTGGEVSVTFISGNDAQTAYIKATVDDNGIYGSAEATVQVSPDASPNFIYLASDSLSLSVTQTGGVEMGWLRATVYDINGNPVPEGVPVSFVITDGPGGSEHLDVVGYGPYETVTNSQGVASASIHSGTRSGTLRVRAQSDAVLSNAAQILIAAGPAVYIVVGAEECNVDYWDNVAEYNNVVAVVSDVYLNPVNDSTVVYFSTDEGTMVSHQERTGNQEGIATSKWISGNNVATANGRVLVIAETSGGTVVDTSMFFNTHFPDTLIVSGVPSSILADGKSKFYVWVSGYDLNGNPVIGGTQFNADANYLIVGGGSLEDGCFGANARVELRSAVLDMDYSVTGGNDDGIGAVDVVTYWHEAGAATSFTVLMTTGPAFSGNSSISVQGAAVGGEVANFNVVVKDRFGNPLADHTLNITVPSGTPSPATVETNAYGEAYFSWLVPGAPGEYPVVASDTDPRGGINLAYSVVVEE